MQFSIGQVNLHLTMEESARLILLLPENPTSEDVTRVLRELARGILERAESQRQRKAMRGHKPEIKE